MVSKTPDNVVNACFVDFVRVRPLLWLPATFSISILIISRWKGLRAMLSMAFSLFIAGEIVRTLVGLLGLIAAVPLTTAIATWLALHGDRLGKLT